MTATATIMTITVTIMTTPAMAPPPRAGPARRPGTGAVAPAHRPDGLPTEETLIRKKLGGMPDVHGLEFNLMQRLLTVVHAEGARDAVMGAIRSWA